MRPRSRFRQLGDSRGQSLVEFSLSALMLVLLLFGVFEISRMLLIYTTIANAARIGTRFASAHGSQSGTAVATATDVQNVVTNYLSAAPMNTASALISVTGAGGAIGSTVTVTVNYKYDPFVSYFPLSVYLASTSQGVIAF